MTNEQKYRIQLQRLVVAVQGFRNIPRLGKRKHRKLRRDPAYSEMCRAWEESADLLDENGGII